MSTTVEPVATAAPAPGGALARLARRPARTAVFGALFISATGMLVRAAAVSPEAAALYRCAYALPVLLLLGAREDRRYGRRRPHDRRVAALAGVFFALDLVLWHHSIDAVGAGLATVLGNLQVAVVTVVAWLFFGERPGRSFALAAPVLAAGVVLVSGVIGAGAYGDDPVLGVVYGIGTSFAYAGFILTLRRGGRDLRRPAGPLGDATAVAALVLAPLALLRAPADVVPHWPAHGWLLLLGLVGQVAGWLFISVSLPRLPAAVTSVLLLVQPVVAMLLAAALFAEHPSAAQLFGCGLVLAGVVIATARRRGGVALDSEPGGGPGEGSVASRHP